MARLDAGTYGTCASCGETIAKGRLAALPATPVCTGCAS
jgi:RNA polymerase-binding transcription factor DksA